MTIQVRTLNIGDTVELQLNKTRQLDNTPDIIVATVTHIDMEYGNVTFDNTWDIYKSDGRWRYGTSADTVKVLKRV